MHIAYPCGWAMRWIELDIMTQHVIDFCINKLLWFNNTPDIILANFLSFKFSSRLKLQFWYFQPLQHTCCNLSSSHYKSSRYRYQLMTCYTNDFTGNLNFIEAVSLLWFHLLFLWVATWFGTWHDSFSVVKCVKFYCNHPFPKTSVILFRPLLYLS